MDIIIMLKARSFCIRLATAIGLMGQTNISSSLRKCLKRSPSIKEGDNIAPVLPPLERQPQPAAPCTDLHHIAQQTGRMQASSLALGMSCRQLGRPLPSCGSGRRSSDPGRCEHVGTAHAQGRANFTRGEKEAVAGREAGGCRPSIIPPEGVILFPVQALS